MHQPRHPASASPSASSESGGTFYLVLIQVMSRGLTFLGNQFLLRYLSLALLGLAVQLELLSVTVLYFARESLRVAIQRQPGSKVDTITGGRGKPGEKRASSQEIVNLAYVVLLVGLGASVGFGYSYLQRSSNEVMQSANFLPAFRLYAAATLIELVAEPCFVVIQHYSLYKGRARAETSAAISRCLTACVATVVLHRYHRPVSVLPLALGQLSYAVTLLVVYLYTVVPIARANAFSLLPSRLADGGDDDVQEERSRRWLNLFSKSLLSLTSTFYVQSLFKLFLTHGDSLILSFLADLNSQGAFALASNYGGLLSRLIFQPVEESSRNVFGHLLSSAAQDEELDTSKNTNKSKVGKSTLSADARDTGAEQSEQYKNDVGNSDEANSTFPPSNLQHGLSHLTTTLHVYTLFSLPILALIPTILPVAARLVFSAQWCTSETISLLQAYIWYLPFLAINGVLDAFVTSVATPSQLASQSLIMTAITIAYGLFSWILMAKSELAGTIRSELFMNRVDRAPFGSAGLVYANIFNMSLRIIYSVWFIKNWIGEKRKRFNSISAKEVQSRSLPSLSCMLIAAVAAIVLPRLTSTDADAPKRFIGIPGLSAEDVTYVTSTAVVLGTSILVTESQFLLKITLPFIPARFASKIRPYLLETGSTSK